MKYIKLVDSANICLYQSAGSVDLVFIRNKFISNLFNQMKSVMLENKGIGLAAPQVGLSMRIIIFLDENNEVVKMINPKILNYSEETNLDVEGCLSYPGLSVPVYRSDIIDVEWTSTDGSRKQKKYYGITSRIIQHELDHLDGITIQNKSAEIILRKIA